MLAIIVGQFQPVAVVTNRGSSRRRGIRSTGRRKLQAQASGN